MPRGIIQSLILSSLFLQQVLAVAFCGYLLLSLFPPRSKLKEIQ